MGGSRSVRQKKALTKFFSPQLILQKSNGQFQRNLSFFKIPDGVQHFPGGVGGGGSNCLFSIETHITCDFPGGVGTPCPPLWIRTCMLCEHRQLRRACANAQSHQGIRCSHTPRIHCWIHCCVPAHIKKGNACRRRLSQ